MTDVTLLDGGVGQEIVRRAGGSGMRLWATEAMRRAPGTATQVHRDFLAAGATVAMANTYAVLPDRLASAGFPEALPALRAQAMAEARTACDKVPGVRLAATIGPLGASYRPDLMPPHAEAVAVYTDAVAALAPGADLIVFETIASLAHLRAALSALSATERPGWIALTIDDEDGTRLRSGETVAKAVRLIADSPAAAALANCAAPEAMPAALEGLLETGLPAGAYANAFETITKDFLARPAVENLTRRRDMGPEQYTRHALDWVARGATIVGGCCETGPAHIAAVAQGLRAAGHRIV